MDVLSVLHYRPKFKRTRISVIGLWPFSMCLFCLLIKMSKYLWPLGWQSSSFKIATGHRTPTVARRLVLMKARSLRVTLVVTLNVDHIANQKRHCQGSSSIWYSWWCICNCRLWTKSEGGPTPLLRDKGWKKRQKTEGDSSPVIASSDNRFVSRENFINVPPIIAITRQIKNLRFVVNYFQSPFVVLSVGQL